MLQSTDQERLISTESLKEDTRIFLGRGHRIDFECGLGKDWGWEKEGSCGRVKRERILGETTGTEGYFRSDTETWCNRYSMESTRSQQGKSPHNRKPVIIGSLNCTRQGLKWRD